jgi:hypothetical protein
LTGAAVTSKPLKTGVSVEAAEVALSGGGGDAEVVKIYQHLPLSCQDAKHCKIRAHIKSKRLGEWEIWALIFGDLALWILEVVPSGKPGLRPKLIGFQLTENRPTVGFKKIGFGFLDSGRVWLPKT